jgi:hypothetical protein
MAHRTQEQRRAIIIISCSIFLVAGLGAVAVVATGRSMSGQSSQSPTSAIASPDADIRTAKITNNADGKDCWQQTFDNQTGRMTRTQQPCEATAYDSNGVPIPLGTIHRLDAISKSFSSH